MEGDAPTAPGTAEKSGSPATTLKTKTSSRTSLLKSKPGTTKSSRVNLAAGGSQANLAPKSGSKAGSKRGSQATLAVPATAADEPATATAPETDAPPTAAPDGTLPPDTDPSTSDQKDASLEARLQHSLSHMESVLSLSTPTEPAPDPEDATVGEEIEVIPQIARLLLSPILSATEIAAEGGFTFVNAEYDGFDLDGISHVQDVLSVLPLAFKTYMRSGSSEDMMADSLSGGEIPRVVVRTPMMRPTSPTMDEEEERKKREAEAAALANPDGMKADEATAAAIAIVEEGVDREALIASIKNELDLKEKYKIKNLYLQNKLGEYFKRKRTDEAHDGEKSVADQEQRYTNCMTSLTTLRTEYESLNGSNQKIVNEYKLKLEEHTAEAHEKSEEFVKFKRSTALSAENSRTGKGIPPKQYAQLEAMDQRKEMEVVAVRLEHIKLRNKLKRHEQLLRQKEELADGLHLIDFEQLKIENQTYNEKIEERNEELLKLRKKITNIVQVLTHVKEKLQFVQAENGSLRKELKRLEANVAVRRDSLPASKQARDGIKNLNISLRQKNGLLGNKPLLRDFEDKVDETDALKARIDELRSSHANLAAETLSIKRQIQRKLIV
ncbi:Coiled-coil domain-containing protein 96 [Podochytrium sp. JEL0797]|nr:Coiled-coil domain-containing protein 96 [Podochytrium sp. JEL0797]